MFLKFKEVEKIIGNLVDVFNEEIYPAEISIEAGIIVSIDRVSTKTTDYLLPGFIDSHIHIESSMLTPQNFSRIAVSHGTLAVVSDPHEIANVLGIEGVRYMIDNAKQAEIKFFFGAPSCVPATSFESSGGNIGPDEIESLFQNEKLHYLSELMNYPGVIYNDEEVLRKISIAKQYRKPIDGHAPGLTGKDLKKYIDSGILTDHECASLDEAVEKIKLGMIVQIREGSAAKNFEALWPLIDKYPDKVFLCSDDLHPDDLVKGHINLLVSKAVKRGVGLFNVLKAVTVFPNKHYSLNMGMLRQGDSADFIKVDNLETFNVLESYLSGKKVYDKNSKLPDVLPQKLINNFIVDEITPDDLVIHPQSNNNVKVISVIEGELITKSFSAIIKNSNGDLVSDIENDILKLTVVNRYQKETPALAFIHNFKLKKGAIAGSIAHDSHNIIAVGVSNIEISECINWIIKNKGGIAIHNGKQVFGIPLPIAGIISDQSAEIVGEQYSNLNKLASELGCDLRAPFMTLSFMALLVIPELKLSNKGLFDGLNFSFTSLFDN